MNSQEWIIVQITIEVVHMICTMVLHYIISMIAGHFKYDLGLIKKKGRAFKTQVN